jgi:hypothetical protein
LLLLLRLVLHILLVLLVLLLLRLLISHPRKGRISIIFPMSRLASSLLHCISGALLLTPASTVIPASSGRACSLPDRNILADTFVADIPVILTGILLNYRLFFGDCRIKHLDLLVPAAEGHTSDMPSAWMRG